jgi:hypothetical protein
MAKFFHLVPPVVASLALAPAIAQTVSISFSAQAPLSAQMTVGTQTAQSTMPAGPLALNSSIAASPLSGATASTSWYTSLVEGFAVLNNQVNSGGAGPASGSAGPNEIVVSFTATSPVAAWIEVTRYSGLTPGQPWPTTAIDFDNNGTIEQPNLGTTASLLVSLGPTPWSIRIVLTSQLVSTGGSFTTVELRARPENHVDLFQTAVGCGPMGRPALHVENTLVGAGIAATFESVLPVPFLHPHVFVFGWGMQPVRLPPVYLPPCLLMPTLDVVLPGAATAPSVIYVPLPAAVRPVTFHLQAVGLLPAGLATTDAFIVIAN